MKRTLDRSDTTAAAVLTRRSRREAFRWAWAGWMGLLWPCQHISTGAWSRGVGLLWPCPIIDANLSSTVCVSILAQSPSPLPDVCSWLWSCPAFIFWPQLQLVASRCSTFAPKRLIGIFSWDVELSVGLLVCFEQPYDCLSRAPAEQKQHQFWGTWAQI